MAKRVKRAVVSTKYKINGKLLTSIIIIAILLIIWEVKQELRYQEIRYQLSGIVKFAFMNRLKIENLNEEDIRMLRTISEKIYLDKRTTETVLYNNLRINDLDSILSGKKEDPKSRLFGN